MRLNATMSEAPVVPTVELLYSADGRVYAENVRLPDTVTSIGASAFLNCVGLKEISVPGTVTAIGNYAFQNCTDLIALSLPEGILTVGSRAIQNTGLAELSLPSTITKFDNYCFASNNKLRELHLNQAKASYGQYCFNKCLELAILEFPAGTISLGNYCCADSPALVSVFMLDEAPPVCGTLAFRGTRIDDGTGRIYVPAKSVEAYRSAQNWSVYASRIVAVEG